MASSTKNSSHLQIPHEYGTTAAPPPTPLSNPISSSSSSSADFLSGLLHRLPPSLSLPTPRRPIISPPIISLTHHQTPNLILLASQQTGFFQLTNHSIPSKLAQSAESESLSLFHLPPHQKLLLGFPTNTWPPLGFDFDDDDEQNDHPKLLCLDSSTSIQTHPATEDLSLNSLQEFIRQMERLGLEVIQLLSQSLGLVNPVQNDPTRISSLLWVSEFTPSSRMYPYVVGLQYQIRSQKYSLQTGSGLVSVSPQIDSVLVSLGDIAKVWSNGQIKNVKGRPMPIIGDDDKEDENRRCITMSLLLSVALDSTVSPLLSMGKNVSVEEREIIKEEEDEVGNEDIEAAMKFKSFCFEDYAWRVYHERVSTKDPLDRYLI